MREIRTFAFAAFATAALAAPAAALTLDFDSGTSTFSSNLLTRYEQGGLVFDITHTSSEGPNLFNAVCPGGVNPDGQTSRCASAGDDKDLLPAGGAQNGVSGNILIREEDSSDTVADDARGSGDIIFTLVSGPAFSVLGFSAIDNETFSILVGGQELGRIEHQNENQTTALTFVDPSPVTTNFTVRYFGSGGVDSIVLAPVPLPAGLPLLLAGIGGLAFLRRRRPA